MTLASFNYYLSAAILFLFVLLFIKTVLPQSLPPTSEPRQTDPKTLRYKLTVLAMNSTHCLPRGGGIKTAPTVKTLKRFFKKAERVLSRGKTLKDHERILLSAKASALRAIELIEDERISFCKLPHHGKYPRIFEMCRLLTDLNNGDVDSIALKEAVRTFGEYSPLKRKEIKALPAVLAFCLIAVQSVIAARSLDLSEIEKRAISDAEKQQIDLTLIKYNAYVSAFFLRSNAESLHKFSAVCFENGIDVRSARAEYALEVSNYAATAVRATDSLAELETWLTESYLASLEYERNERVGEQIPAAAVEFSADMPLKKEGFSVRKIMRGARKKIKTAFGSFVAKKVRENSVRTEAVQTRYDSFGLYPRTRFLFGGEYLSRINDRGEAADSFRSQKLFERGRLCVCGEDSAPLKYQPPFVTEWGRTILNATALGKNFAAEYTALTGGKLLEITSRAGSEYKLEYSCKPLLKFGGVQTKHLDGCDMFYVSESGAKAPLFFAVAVPSFARAKAYEKRGIFSVVAPSFDGAVRLCFCADHDLGKLAGVCESAFSSGAKKSGMAAGASLAALYGLTPHLCEVASYILGAKCVYPDIRLEKYIDLSLNTVRVSLIGGEDNAFEKVKQLAVLKRLGLDFNVVLFLPHSMDARREFSFESSAEELLRGRGRLSRISVRDDEESARLICDSSEDFDKITSPSRLEQVEIRAVKRISLPIDKPEILSEKSVGVFGDAIACDGFASSEENRLASEGMKFVIRADGSGYTFTRGGKVTADYGEWEGAPSEYVTIAESGRVWSASPLPYGEKEACYCLHSAGATRFVCTANALKTSETVFAEKGVKVYRLEIYNPRKTSRKLTVAACVSPELSECGEHTLRLFDTERGMGASDVKTDRTVYFTTDAPVFTREREQGGRTVLMLKAEIKVPPRGEAALSFMLSRDLPYEGETITLPQEKRLPFEFATADKNFDEKAALASFKARSLFKVPPAEDYGFELLGAITCAVANEELCRRKILAACRRRFKGGDILARIEGGKGIRARDSAQALLLPIAAARYIDVTDDREVLFERATYLVCAGDNCRRSKEAFTLLYACVENLFAAEIEDAAYLGIRAQILALKAITDFMPLVRDGETKLRLACERERLAEKARALPVKELTLGEAALLATLGVIRLSAREIKDKLALSKTPLDTIFACAALIAADEKEESFSVFESFDPLENDSPEAILLAAALMTECYFGCKVKGDCLVLSPNLPKKIQKANISCSLSDGFDVEIDNTGSGEWKVSLNGIAYGTNSLGFSPRLSKTKIKLVRR